MLIIVDVFGLNDNKQIQIFRHFMFVFEVWIYELS